MQNIVRGDSAFQEGLVMLVKVQPGLEGGAIARTQLRCRDLWLQLHILPIQKPPRLLAADGGSTDKSQA